MSSWPKRRRYAPGATCTTGPRRRCRRRRPNSSLALVSEQPGDREDQPGHPFVGPAGRLLDQALRESGIDRAAPGRLEEVGVGEWRGPVLSTVHPSSILRTPDSGAREKALAGFVADLVKAREAPAA